MMFQNMSLFLLCVGVGVLCVCIGIIARSSFESSHKVVDRFTSHALQPIDTALEQVDGLYSGSDPEVLATIKPIHKELRKKYKASFDIVQQRLDASANSDIS